MASEENRPQLGCFENPFEVYRTDIREFLAVRYTDPRQILDARNDALILASAEMLTARFSCFYEDVFAEDHALLFEDNHTKWSLAVESAEKGDWSKIQQLIFEEAEEERKTAMMIPHEVETTDAMEREATWLLNLYESLSLPAAPGSGPQS